MVNVSRVLCPVDFSDASHLALRSALQLARWYGAEVVVAHIISIAVPPAPFRPAPAFLLSPDDRRATERRLREFVDAAGPGDLPVRTELRDGAAVEELLGLARDLPADLVVMGTHGRSGFEHLMMGSVTERVLRKARCPVLTVREGSGHLPAAPPAPFRRVLCAVDFSTASLEALKYATSLADEAGGGLIVLHVPDWPAGPSGLDVLGPRAAEYQRRLTEAASVRLRDVVPEAARDWADVEERVDFGRPWEVVLAQAERGDVDLIVMGAHGREGLLRHVLGSTTDHVVRGASCPVLVVREAVPGASAGAQRASSNEMMHR